MNAHPPYFDNKTNLVKDVLVATVKSGDRMVVVHDPRRPSLVMCPDVETSAALLVPFDTIDSMAKLESDYAVMCDVSVADDAPQANFEEPFKTDGPDIIRRVF